jgi:hypothetical protein
MVLPYSGFWTPSGFRRLDDFVLGGDGVDHEARLLGGFKGRRRALLEAIIS